MIERLFPGVHVTEVPSVAKPIDGVSTRMTPDWADLNTHDPGVALLDLVGYALDAGMHHTHPSAIATAAHLHLGAGVVGGLAIRTCDASETPEVTVSPGFALSAAGRTIDADSTAALLRVLKP